MLLPLKCTNYFHMWHMQILADKPRTCESKLVNLRAQWLSCQVQLIISNFYDNPLLIIKKSLMAKNHKLFDFTR